ncbi:MAG TPA: hypothetical protein VHE09_05830, partial [Rhizomicrobium sp.]|nr:hypothetical protein [Rhizomicrobium sp.]
MANGRDFRESSTVTIGFGAMAEEHKAGDDTSRLAAALAAGQGGDRADRFLDEQTRLTRLQIEQLEEENATRRRMLKLE